jgi:hypothetical protein
MSVSTTHLPATCYTYRCLLYEGAAPYEQLSRRIFLTLLLAHGI